MGSFIRTVQRANRDADRQQAAKQIEPLEKQKQFLDAVILNIDKVILALEQYIAKNSGK